MENYTPSYDVEGEISKHEKDFKDLIGEGNSIDNVLGNGYKQSLQDKSIYASEFRNYLDSHLSDKAKNQIALDKKAEYWNNLSSIYSIDDPVVKAQRAAQLKSAYTQSFQNETNAQLEDVAKQKNTLSAFASLISPQNADLLHTYNEQITKLSDYEKQLKQRGLPQSEIDLLTDVNNWQTGQDLYAQKYSDNQITKIAESAAHNKISQKLETDQAYWNLKTLQKDYVQITETSRHNKEEENIAKFNSQLKLEELGLKFDGNGFSNSGNEQQEDVLLSGGEKIESPQAMGEKIYNDRREQIVQNSGQSDLINKVLGGDNLTKDAQNPIVSQLPFYQKYEGSSKVIKIAKAAGVSPKDNIAEATKKIGTWLTDDHALSTMTAGNNGDPEIMDVLKQAKTSLSIANSAAKNLQSDLHQAINLEAKNIVGADGVRFADTWDNNAINTLEDLHKALETFDKEHGSITKPISLPGMERYGQIVAESYGAKNEPLTTISSTEDKYNKILEAFYNLNPASKVVGHEYRNTRNTNEALKPYQTRYNNDIVHLAVGANDHPELAELIKNNPHLISDSYGGQKGFGVLFKTNAPAEEQKTFVAEYNAMAEKENLPKVSADKPAEIPEAYVQAVQNLNSKFKTGLRIQSRNFDSNDPKYKVDPLNQMMLENSHSLESLNITIDKAKDLYKLPSTVNDNIIVKATNRSHLSGDENLDLSLDVHYPIVQIDSKGNFLKTRVGDPVVEMQNSDKVMKALFKGHDFTEQQKQLLFTKNLKSNLENLSQDAQTNLDLILYLKNNPQATNINYVDPIQNKTIKDIFKL